jgi:Zn-dependent protease with chaperone function
MMQLMTQTDRTDADDELQEAIWPKDRPTPTRILRCRHCRRRNRIPVPIAVMTPERVACGGCGGALLVARDQPLELLSSTAYQHSLDRRSLDALRSVPGLPRFVEWALGSVGDRSAHILFLSDAILCGDNQFPELVALMNRARRRIDLPYEPTLFLGESPHMNAMTTGTKMPVIVVRSALLDQMNNEELVAILGHELGHLHADHPLHQSVARMLLQGGAASSSLVRLLGMPLRRALLKWIRSAELTADRAALLASGRLTACIGVMLNFAGGNRPGISDRTRMRFGPFIEQCRFLARIQTPYSFDGILGEYLAMDRTHPHVAWRVMNLIQWIEHGNYLNILGGEYVRRARVADAIKLLPSGGPGRADDRG